jgi:arylsulfatase A-like enzyme
MINEMDQKMWTTLRLFLMIAACMMGQPTISAECRPNVVFVLADDWGWTDAGCLGSPLYETPHIDRLAAEGVRFTNAYAAHPVCGPSRMAILSGRHPTRLGNLGVTGNLALEHVTIAEGLKKAGYHTFFAGKWHLGGGPKLPKGQGFDVSFGATAKGQPSSYFFPYKSTTGRLTSRDVPDLEDGQQGDYLTDALTDKALGFIDQHRAEPFFLYLSHYAVHTPLQAKEEVVAKCRKKVADLQLETSPVLKDESNGAVTSQLHNHPVYAAMVESLDESVGRIMARLSELKLDEQTIVILTSDHGGLSTARRGHTQIHGITSNLPLRAGKGWCYEGGIRVPLLIKWPGHTEPGSTCESPVTGTDHYPTILEMAGLPLCPKQHADGISMVPLLEGAGGSDAERPLHWSFPHAHGSGTPGSSAIRVGNWKLIQLGRRKPELYDLSRDISETTNLSVQMPEKTTELLAELNKARQQ